MILLDRGSKKEGFEAKVKIVVEGLGEVRFDFKKATAGNRNFNLLAKAGMKK